MYEELGSRKNLRLVFMAMLEQQLTSRNDIDLAS